MDAREIQELVRDVFGRGYGTEVSNGWVKMRCPLARWTHEKGSDSSPSSGISIQPTNVSIFSCFTCHTKTPVHGLLRKWSNYTGDDLGGLIEELENSAYLGSRTLPEWGDRQHASQPELPDLDKAIFLGLYEPAAGHQYLLDRGISDETADRLQLMLDPEDPVDGEERILFPVFGLDGTLHGFSGRATNKGARMKVRDYMGLPKAHCVLGAHLFGGEERPDKILVVEGLFDYANAWECGQPAVAVMHSSLTEAQARILREIGLPTYDFYDDDAAGRKGGASLGQMLRDYQPTMKTRYPEIWIEDETEDEGGHWLKDPGDMLPEDFEEMIRDSRFY